MNVQLTQSILPQHGRVEINIQVSAEIQVSAAMARRRVSRLVVSEIGNLLYGGEPSLHVAEQISWRVPVILAYPDTGPVGQVGTLDVDIETGQVLATETAIQEIRDYAAYLAQRTAIPST